MGTTSVTAARGARRRRPAFKSVWFMRSNRFAAPVRWETGENGRLYYLLNAMLRYVRRSNNNNKERYNSQIELMKRARRRCFLNLWFFGNFFY